MKLIRPTYVLLAALVAPAALPAQTAATAPAAPAATASPIVARTRTSPHETVSTKVDGKLVTVTYGRPYTKAPKTGEMRKIWGGLVKWDKADRMGADEATTLVLQDAVIVGTTTVPAGAYTLYIIPSENGATKLALSTAIGKWGIPVDESKDFARFDLVKTPLASSVDQLTLAVEKGATAGTGVLRIQWETTEFSLPFTLKK